MTNQPPILDLLSNSLEAIFKASSEPNEMISRCSTLSFARFLTLNVGSKLEEDPRIIALFGEVDLMISSRLYFDINGPLPESKILESL
ncbi:hypothetical protein WICMUC_000662 [Wickerhamomyces mucosus]|uniref:Uncharacterized protein n=1 Tax=Wickerhamomyces mucosus TaxID=1378264 RepID=A0A9P8PZ59_9ASCO|nr:hypothetical protein WICMUC_000662 [Wickerhamomyces mucosus]